MPEVYRHKLPLCFRSEADRTSKVESGGGSGPEPGRICHRKSWFPGAFPLDKVVGRATDPSGAQGNGSTVVS